MRFEDSKFFAPVFFAALFLGLFLLFRSSFGNPPRSDFWSAFHTFHQVDPETGRTDLVAVINHDPWRHGTFRPLSHLILYFQHRLFGSDFIWSHIINFAAYCLSLLLVYLFARELAVDRFLAAVFIGLAAFLFSHFDIVTWTFHVFTLLGFAAMLGGFILYSRYLKTGRGALLATVPPLFLFGMLSSETYSLWPLGMLILGLGARSSFAARKPAVKSPGRVEILLLAAVYLLYIAVFIATRRAEHHTGPLAVPSATQLTTAFFSAFFNLLYTGVGVNLVQALNLPAAVYHNLDMGGLLISWRDQLFPIVTWTGIIALAATVLTAVILVKKKKMRAGWTMGLLLFLLITNFFVISSGRAVTNILMYVFAQFRYQFVPNVLTALLAATAVDKLLKPTRREKFLIAVILVPILASNIFTVSIYLPIIKRNLEPLKNMIAEIRGGLEGGMINPDQKLFIDEQVTREMSPLCWNRDMGRFIMNGTYEWMFSRSEIEAFAFSRNEATWEIRPGQEQRITRIPGR